MRRCETRNCLSADVFVPPTPLPPPQWSLFERSFHYHNLLNIAQKRPEVATVRPHPFEINRIL